MAGCYKNDVTSYFSQDIVCNVKEGLVRGPTPSGATSLCEENVVKHLLRFLKFFADVDVVVHSEHLRLLLLRQILAKYIKCITQILRF